MLSLYSELNNGEKELVLGYSIMKFQIQPGLDIRDILITQMRFSTHSQMLIKILSLTLVLTLQHQKERKVSKENGKRYAKCYLKYLLWMILNIHINRNLM